jgi:hypothetical protein
VLAIKARKSGAVIVARVEGFTLRGADLEDWSLSHADLMGFDLREARLCRCRLLNADLRCANLCATDLSEAQLHGALLSGAVYDEVTRWPSDFDPRAAGAVPQDPAHPWEPGRGQHQAEVRAYRFTAQGTRARSREACEHSQRLRAAVEAARQKGAETDGGVIAERWNSRPSDCSRSPRLADAR